MPEADRSWPRAGDQQPAGRNRNFSGRDELLEQLYASWQAEAAAAVVVPTGAVHGLGGVGKTELALELRTGMAAMMSVATSGG